MWKLICRPPTNTGDPFLVNVAYYERDPDNCRVSDPSRARTPNPTNNTRPGDACFDAPNNHSPSTTKPSNQPRPTNLEPTLDIPTSFKEGRFLMLSRDEQLAHNAHRPSFPIRDGGQLHSGSSVPTGAGATRQASRPRVHGFSELASPIKSFSQTPHSWRRVVASDETDHESHRERRTLRCRLAASRLCSRSRTAPSSRPACRSLVAVESQQC